MRRFVIRFAVFAATLLAVLTLVTLIPLSDDFLVFKTANTGYSKLGWDLRLFRDRAPELAGATVFIGPSYFNNGIDTDALTAGGLKAFNLAVNLPGREMDLYLTRKALRAGVARIVYCAMREPAEGHPMAALILNPFEYLEAGQTVNYSFVTFFAQRVLMEVAQAEWWLSGHPEGAPDPAISPTGHVPAEGSVTADAWENLRRQVESPTWTQRLVTAGKDLFLGPAGDNFVYQDLLSDKGSQSRALRKVVALCREAGVLPLSLRIPGLADTFAGAHRGPPLASAQVLPVLELPDDRFLQDPALWANEGHLSKAGSTLFTQAVLPLLNR